MSVTLSAGPNDIVLEAADEEWFELRIMEDTHLLRFIQNSQRAMPLQWTYRVASERLMRLLERLKPMKCVTSSCSWSFGHDWCANSSVDTLETYSTMKTSGPLCVKKSRDCSNYICAITFSEAHHGIKDARADSRCHPSMWPRLRTSQAWGNWDSSNLR